MSDKCPVCGMPVRIIRRKSGAADHYEPIRPESSDDLVAKLDKDTADWLRKERAGKKTVAFVGTATTSCGFAPYDDMDVEIWSMNETHNYKWMTRANRWFQIHNSASFQRETDSHGNKGHYEWLKTNPWNIPIYMQFHYDEIPNSIEYPLQNIAEFFRLFSKGRKKIKYLTSSFAYMMALALMDGFERIELYGFEMSDDIEYVKQKACAEFWIGQALGRGVEVYTPENCQILHSDLYGGRGYGFG